MLNAVTFTKPITLIYHPYIGKGNDFSGELFVLPKYRCFDSSCPVIEDNGESLRFNSQFESGNLRKAVQVRK